MPRYNVGATKIKEREATRQPWKGGLAAPEAEAACGAHGAEAAGRSEKSRLVPDPRLSQIYAEGSLGSANLAGPGGRSAFGANLSAASSQLRIGRGPWLSEAEIDDKLDQFNQGLAFLDIKRWDEVNEAKEAGEQGNEPAQKSLSGETPGAPGEAAVRPTIAQSTERAKTLQKVRKNIRSIDALYKAYKIEIKCSNGSHQGYLQPFKGVNVQEALQFRCANCTVQGEKLTSNSLGFFRCSEAGCMHCICLLCALASEGGPMSPQLFKLPLCEDLMAPQNKNFGSNGFVCSSPNQKWKPDIPSEWAVCESQFLVEEHIEKEFLRDFQGYEAVNSQFKLCIKCALKWKEFDFKSDVDYTKEERPEPEQTLGPLKVASPKADLEKSKCPDEDVLRVASADFIEATSQRQITEQNLKIGRYIPQERDFNATFPVLSSAFAASKINYLGNTEVLCKQLRFIEYRNNFWPIVQTQETLENLAGETSFIKTIRIYSTNLKPVKSIILEEVPFVPKFSKLFFSSVLQYKSSIFYWKRIKRQDDGESKESPLRVHKKLAAPIRAQQRGGQPQAKTSAVSDGAVSQKKQRLALAAQSIVPIPESDLQNELGDEAPLANDGAAKNEAQMHKLLQSMATNPSAQAQLSNHQAAPMQSHNSKLAGMLPQIGKDATDFQQPAVEQEKTLSELRLFKFNLITKTEAPVLNYVLDEAKEYLSPFFGKPFGDTFIVYTEKNGHLQATEVFKESIAAIRYAEKFMTDCQSQGNSKPGYLVLDANSRQSVGGSGQNELCIQSAKQDDQLLQDDNKYDVNADNVEQLSPKETEQDFVKLFDQELDFFKRQYVVFQRYKSKDDGPEAVSQDESIDLMRRPTIKQTFRNNLKSLLDFKNQQERQCITLINPTDYQNVIKVYQMDDIEKPIAHFSTLNKLRQSTNVPISLFLFTTELTKCSNGPQIYKTPRNNENGEQDEVSQRQTSKRDTNTVVDYHSNYKSQSISEKVVFVLTDDKIYHYAHFRPCPGNSNTPRAIEEHFELEIFDQIVINDDAMQNIQQIEIEDICLPNQLKAHKFKQYLLINYQTQELVPIYPNFNNSDQTMYHDGNNGEEKMVSIHKRTKDIAMSKLMGNIGAASIITANRVDEVDSHHRIRVRNTQELKQALLTFLNDIMVSFEIEKEKNNQLKLHLIDTRLTTTLFLLDQQEDSIQSLTYKNTNNLGQIIMDIQDSKEVRELPISAAHPNRDKICNLQRNILEQAINLRFQILHINSTFQNTISSNSEIYLYEEKKDPELFKCSINHPNQNIMVLEIPQNDGRYSQLHLQAADVTAPFEYVMRCLSHHHQIFVFKNNGIPIFIRKTYAEVEKLVSQKQAIIQLETEIMYFKKIDDDNRIEIVSDWLISDFIQLKDGLKQRLFDDYRVHFEPVVDTRHKSSFMAMLYTDKTGCDSQTLLFFNFDAVYIKQECVEPTDQNKSDLYAQDVAIVRTSDRIKSEGGQDTYYTMYHYIYAYDRQGDRFQLNTVALIEHELQPEVESEQVARLKVLPEENIEIKVCGMNSMIPSMKQRQLFQCAYFKAIPLYGDEGMTIKGMQLIINNNMDNTDGQMIVNFINQEFDPSQFKYETDLMKFDIKKIYCNNQDQLRYYLIAKAFIQTNQIVEKRFNNFELNYLLETMISILLHMVPFDFAKMIFEQQEFDFNSKNFFKSQEILAGKSACDINLGKPFQIQIALMNLKANKLAIEHHNKHHHHEYQHQVIDIQTSILEQHVINMPCSIKQRLVESLFFKQDQFLIMDFNFVSQIQRAFDIQAIKSAEMLIKYVFETTGKYQSSHHQNIMMLVLPQILKCKKLDSYFQTFFRKSQLNSVAGNFCNFETRISDTRTPQFSDLQKNYQHIAEIRNYRNPMRQIVAKLELDHQLKKETKMRQAAKMEESKNKHKLLLKAQQIFDIEHSYVDFQHLILGEKLNLFNQNSDEGVFFDDYYLSKLIAKSKCRDSFYVEPSMKRIIDYQFAYTRPRWKVLAIIYITCFYLPLIWSLFTNTKEIEFPIFTLGILTQALFFMIELIQIRFRWRTYLKESIWNWIEFTQFFVYIMYVYEEVRQALILDDDKQASASRRRLSSFATEATGSANAYASASMFDAQNGQPAAYGETLLGLFQQAAVTTISTLWPQAAGHRHLQAADGCANTNSKVDVESTSTIIVTVLLVIGGFAKILYFIRIFKEYGLMVSMVAMTIKQFTPYSVYLGLWIALFTALYQALQCQVSGGGYEDLPDVFRIILVTFGNSIGNISQPEYPSWSAQLVPDDAPLLQIQNRTIIGLIWITWTLNQFVIMIIMMNFLVTVLVEVYTDVAENQSNLNYKHKAELNHEFYMITEFFNLTTEFKILVFSVAHEEDKAQEEARVDFVAMINQFTATQNLKLHAKLDRLQATVDADHSVTRGFNAETHASVQWQTDQIKQTEEQIAQVQQQLLEINLNLASVRPSVNTWVGNRPAVQKQDKGK